MLEKIKTFTKNKKIVGGVVLGVILLVFLIAKGGYGENFSTLTPTYGTWVRSVQATGQVVSSTDLDLSFAKSGVVSSVRVSVGDNVKAGAILATLETESDQAALTKARASLMAAEAKLKKIIEGASNEEIALARVNLENATQDLKNIENTQNTLVSNAYNNLLNSTPEARPGATTSTTVTPPTISGTYRFTNEGDINIYVYSTGGGLLFAVSGLLVDTGSVSTTTPQPIGNSGLYVLFNSTTNLSGTTWTIQLPNKKASNYLSNYNTYQAVINTKASALSSAQAVINQRDAELNLKLASARSADVDLAEADVLAARGEVERAQAAYNDNLIKAPQTGTITRVDTKYGELATASASVITLEDIENLYVEALINESNIASLALAQPVVVTFDALPGAEFAGTISHIDPSAVTSDGVVNYKIKVLLAEKNSNIRSGMNAEISITVKNKENTLSIPKAAIFEKEGANFIKIVTDVKRGKLKEVAVTKGELGDGNMVEILSGLNKEDTVAITETK
ncbi:MAG: efflux RND transporter periplasmic adaptor subunit [Candidatus Paceibacterota bacterium]